MDDLQLVIEETPTQSILDALGNNLKTYNQGKVGDYTAKKYLIYATMKNNKLAGGIYGWLQLGWLYIDWLWVDEVLRGNGLGTQLLSQFEKIAIEKDIHRARLNTASFQGALDFYRRNGYTVIHELDIFLSNAVGEKCHKDYILTKELVA